MKKAKLPKKFKEKWLKALRSGDFTQARKQLQHKGSHCCLGVACKMSGYSHQKMGAYGTITSTQFPLIPGVLCSDKDQDYHGIKDRDGGMVSVPDLLMTMNDTYEDSFDEIADWVEGNL